MEDTANSIRTKTITQPGGKSTPPVMISPGLPPIPAKLVKRIQDGLYVEMSELLPDKLTSAEYNTGEEHTVTQKQKLKVLSIMEWVQAFGIFIAILFHTAPDRIADLMGYQQLIIQASSTCQEGRWAVYDRQFCLKASATTTTQWSMIDINLWNLAFSEQAITKGPQYKPYYAVERGFSNQDRKPPTQQRICLDCNDDPNPVCPYPNCKYEHSCYRCAFNP